MTALAGRCPRCGRGKLFNGFLKLKPRCETCGLELVFAESDDGAAVFIILFAGLIVVSAALVVESKYEPPFWVHALLWIPLIGLVTLAPLRLLKGLTVYLQYQHLAAKVGPIEPDR